MYESHENLEKTHESGESTQEILYAIGQTDPSTHEIAWYTRNPDTQELTPINTAKDEFGITRELLTNDTLGREIRQDPADDPEAAKSLYGTNNETGKPNPNPENTDDGTLQTAAENVLPFHQRTSPKPLALSTETIQESPDPLGTKQGASNALTSHTNKVNESINESDPNPQINPSEFAEEPSEYREKLSSELDHITENLMSSADALAALYMYAPAKHFADKAELLDNTIRAEITAAGEDFATLSTIHAKYFEGSPSQLIARIDPLLSVDSTPEKFKALLDQANTIPEMTHLANSLISARQEQKDKLLAEQQSTTTPVQSPQSPTSAPLTDKELHEQLAA